jgi:Flp pilus assembly protein TadG
MTKGRGGKREGAAAVEFAMVILPFTFMIFALLELGLVFVVDSVLGNATIESGRLIRTGQAEAADMTAPEFRDQLCGRMSIFSTQCDDRVSIDVRVIPAFGSPAPDPMSSGTSFDESQMDFNYGTAGSLVLVRVWYRQPLVTTFLGQGLSRLGDGNARLMSATAFRNEPGGSSPGGSPP